MNWSLGRSVTSLLLAGLLSVILLGTEPAPVHAQTPAATYAAVATHATNLERVAHDLRKIGKNACLRKRALEQARAMARKGELFHQSLEHVQRTCGMGWVGENVAVGYATGDDVVDAWMASPGHRANILKKQYRLVGIAAVKRDGRWWVSQVFGTRA